ncbi:hypothetical protein LY76DRAFT_648554 [Colletotrichum caudatum]|nr:hypothetical protein LY76DRAFT_648554 [Colletotrichum caudatum]
MKDISSTDHLVVARIELGEGNADLLSDYPRGLKHKVRPEEDHYLPSQRRKPAFKDAKRFVTRPYLVQGLGRRRPSPGQLRGSIVPLRISLQTSLWYVGFDHPSKQENHRSIGKHSRVLQEAAEVAKVLADRPETPLLC